MAKWVGPVGIGNDDRLSATAIAELAQQYEQEPIHTPGFIQSHGLLFVLSEPDLHILQVSQNAPDILGVAIADLLGHPISNYLSANQIQTIQSCLERNFEDINPLMISFAAAEEHPSHFNGIVHRAPSGEIVLELEPRVDGIYQDFFQFARQVKTTLAKVQSLDSLQAMCDLIANEIKALTNFDRVMVYRFNAQNNGMVIAEAKEPELEPLLGLNYPAIDIPEPARQLYTINWLRLIADVDYEAIPLMRTEVAIAETTPLDMSYCVLRAVSPCHLQYLHNMGVQASMSISLMKNQQLWGLIACHHYSPRFISYEIRTVCEFLGQLMSVELATKEENEHLDHQLHIKDVQTQLMDQLTEADDFLLEVTAQPERLLQLTDAQGVAVCEQNKMVLIGHTPTEAEIQDLLQWLKPHFERDLLVTDGLSARYEPAKTYQAVASGLLAIAISKIHDRYILWFRPEIAQTVTWAGNPATVTEVVHDGTVRLSPRGSFEEWREEVLGKSLPWLDCEVAAAIELRRMIVDIVLRHADELAKINLELEQSNSELDSFAYIASHDLKEPLRGIHNYATFLVEDYGDILAAEGKEQLYTLVRLTQHLESLIEALLRFSRLGRQELHREPIDLNQLLKHITDIFQMNPQWQDCEIRVTADLPTIWGDRLLVEEIFSNLISNGFKYNQNPQKWVEIGWQTDTNAEAEMAKLYVRDNGIGIRDKHIESVFRIFKRLHPPKKYGGGSGAGLTIVKKIVERHGGEIYIKSDYGTGSTFFFTLPRQPRRSV